MCALWSPGPWDDDAPRNVFGKGESPHQDAIAQPVAEPAKAKPRRTRKPKTEAA